MTAVKSFEASRNKDKQRNIQYLLHKDFAIKANMLENGFRAVRKTILPYEKKELFRKIISFLTLR